jgi:Tfp pilus assembly protein PilF
LSLGARHPAARGDLAGARGRLAEARDSVARARREGRSDALPDSQEVLARMVDLATRDASEAEWQELLARSRTASIEQEPIEVQEMRGLAALRAGQREVAERALRAALRLSSSLPSVMDGRIRRELAAIRAPP